MSYEVLARKWRPQNFSQVIGQEHVLTALSNALDNERLHHAYLFTGTRGVGKTTFARILARCLNCEKGITSKPCGECAACQEITEGRFIDLIEVDAASRTKVDDTRELLDNVQYAPTRGRYKIYLIDEVHMLSGHSFNALLKTLEEPPPHVKFLLATTDPQKLPVTVLSRCLQFNLKAMSPEQIAPQLENILQAENISFESDALNTLAQAANGSMRDALSLLDQAIAHGNNSVTADNVHKMLGTVSETIVIEVLNALSSNDASNLLQQSNYIAEQAWDYESVLAALLKWLHKIALTQIIPNAISTTDMHHQPLKDLAEKINKEDVQLYYQIALLGQRDLPLSPNPRIGFEMTLLRMHAFRPVSSSDGEPTKTPDIQSATVSDKKQHKITEPPQTKNSATPKQQNIETQQTIASQTPELENWERLIQNLNLSARDRTFAQHCIINKKTNDSLLLHLDPKQAPLLNPAQQERLSEALQNHFNKPIKLTISIGNSGLQTPAMVAAENLKKQQSVLFDSLQKDSNVQNILNTFDATINSDSIKSSEKSVESDSTD